MDPTLLQQLQDSSSPFEFITALNNIVKLDDNLFRCCNIRDIIVDSKQHSIIYPNQKDDNLIDAVGNFFLWFLPIDCPQEPISQKICVDPGVAELFKHLLLPNARTSVSIYSITRSICRITYENTEGVNLFITKDLASSLMAAFDRAQTDDDRLWIANAICNIDAHFDKIYTIFDIPSAAPCILRALKKCSSEHPKAFEAVAGVVAVLTAHHLETKTIFSQQDGMVETLLEGLNADLSPHAAGVEWVSYALKNLLLTCPDPGRSNGSEDLGKNYTNIITSPRAVDIIVDAYSRASTVQSVESLTRLFHSVSRIIVARQQQEDRQSTENFKSCCNKKSVRALMKACRMLLLEQFHSNRNNNTPASTQQHRGGGGDDDEDENVNNLKVARSRIYILISHFIGQDENLIDEFLSEVSFDQTATAGGIEFNNNNNEEMKNNNDMNDDSKKIVLPLTCIQTQLLKTTSLRELLVWLRKKEVEDVAQDIEESDNQHDDNDVEDIYFFEEDLQFGFSDVANAIQNIFTANIMLEKAESFLCDFDTDNNNSERHQIYLQNLALLFYQHMQTYRSWNTLIVTHDKLIFDFLTFTLLPRCVGCSASTDQTLLALDSLNSIVIRRYKYKISELNNRRNNNNNSNTVSQSPPPDDVEVSIDPKVVVTSMMDCLRENFDALTFGSSRSPLVVVKTPNDALLNASPSLLDDDLHGFTSGSFWSIVNHVTDLLGRLCTEFTMPRNNNTDNNDAISSNTDDDVDAKFSLFPFHQAIFNDEVLQIKVITTLGYIMRSLDKQEENERRDATERRNNNDNNNHLPEDAISFLREEFYGGIRVRLSEMISRFYKLPQKITHQRMKESLMKKFDELCPDLEWNRYFG